MTRYCPVCRLSNYSRERRLHGRTKCRECGFSAPHAVWDIPPPEPKDTAEPATLHSEEEVKAFLLGIRAAFILTSQSRSSAVSSYGKTMLSKTDQEFKKRYKHFVNMLVKYGVVGCGVSEPAG